MDSIKAKIYSTHAVELKYTLKTKICVFFFFLSIPYVDPDFKPKEVFPSPFVWFAHWMLHLS